MYVLLLLCIIQDHMKNTWRAFISLHLVFTFTKLKQDDYLRQVLDDHLSVLRLASSLFTHIFFPWQFDECMRKVSSKNNCRSSMGKLCAIYFFLSHCHPLAIVVRNPQQFSLLYASFVISEEKIEGLWTSYLASTECRPILEILL